MAAFPPFAKRALVSTQKICLFLCHSPLLLETLFVAFSSASTLLFLLPQPQPPPHPHHLLDLLAQRIDDSSLVFVVYISNSGSFQSTGKLSKPTLDLLGRRTRPIATIPQSYHLVNLRKMSFNLTKRQSTGKPPSNQTESRAPPGLLKALMETGRTKGSSATPAPKPAVPVLSPNPNRAFQAQIDRMNNASHPQEPQSQDMGVSDARHGSSSQPSGGHNRNMSSATQNSFQTQVGGYPSRNPTPALGPSQFRPGENRGLGQASDEVRGSPP